VILNLSSRDAADDAEAFGKAITETLGRSHAPVVRIVYLKDVPRPFRSVARRMIRKREEGGRSLLLDWKGAFHAAFQLDPKVAHFLVVDSAGEVRGPVSGAPTPERLAAFRDMVSGARSESIGRHG